MENITYDDFKKLQMQLGTVRFVEPVEGTDKLLRFELDFGVAVTAEPVEGEEDAEEIELPFGKEEYSGRDIRQIVSGIREFYPEYEQLVGKQLLYVTNLEPREIRGVVSNGMLMAVDGKDGNPVFLVPENPVDPGSKVR